MKNEKGFTFIELIVIMAIISALATASAVFYGKFFYQVAVQNTANGIVGQLRKAQVYAVESRQFSSWGVRNGTGQIILFQGNSYAGRNTAFDETFSIFPTTSVSGFTDVIFSRMTGTPSATPTITVSSGVVTKTITINSWGVVSQ